MMARRGKIKVQVEASSGSRLSPELIAAAGTEHSQQAALMQWVALSWKHEHKRLLFAVPNGGDRRPHVGAAMKAEGVRSGVPDLCWPVPWEEWAGLWIEMKRPGLANAKNGGASDQQIWWLRELQEQGHCAVIAYGWQAAAWVLWLYGRGELGADYVGSLKDENGIFRATPVDAPPVCD